MSTSVGLHRVKQIRIGDKTGYEHTNLSGFYFSITVVDAAGVHSDITLHCEPDVVIKGSLPVMDEPEPYQPLSVARQVEAAKKKLDAWPDWMRKAGRFEGANKEL